MIQNTAEWLELRKTKVGASDAPAIMEVSPWTTPFQLWQEKLDLAPCKEDNWAMKRGREKEDPARLLLEKMTGLFFSPEVRVHDELPWMMASLDAIDPENKYIAEIKTPGKVDHAMAQSGKIPDKYFPQVQHQLEVCKLEMGYYFSYDGEKGILLKIYRDDPYIKKMLAKEKQFYECMQTFKPPALLERDYETRIDQECIDTVQRLIDVQERLKTFYALEEEEKCLREKLIAISGNRNLICEGLKLTRYFRKGAVEYGVIPELKAIDLEKYRKKPIECFKISPPR